MVTLLVLVGCAGGGKDAVLESSDSVDTADLDSNDDSGGESEDSDASESDAAAPDADGDGYSVGEDCDDQNPSVYPGAPETPYDGVDQDCDGGDLIDVDADGHPASAGGGDDCDDANAYVYPGAEEWCDPVDHDCDGAPMADGVCAKVQDIHALAQWIPGFEAILYSTADLTGNGVPDVLAAGDSGLFPNPFGSLSGGVSIFEGGALPGELSQGIAAAAGHTWSMDWDACVLGAPPFDAGDVDGD